MRRVRVRRWYGIAVTVSVGVGIGQAGLADVMVQLDERFGATGTRYPAAALVEAASRVAGRDLGPFFRRYMDGDETLPVHDCLATFGLATRLKPYAGEAYIRQDPTAAPAERARLADLLDLARSADVLHEPI